MKIHTIFYSLLFLSATTFGQERLTLSIDQARQHALEHNRKLINSDYAISKSTLELREAIANGLPQINATADYSNALGAKISIRFNESMPATEIPIKPQSNLTLSVGQLLFSGPYFVGVQTSRLAVKAAELNRSRTELEVLSEVTEAYNLVLISRELVKQIGQNRTNLQSLYDKTAPLEKVGMMERTELDQLYIQVNTLLNAVKSSERQLEMAENLLRLHLGVPADTELELTSSLETLFTEYNFNHLTPSEFNTAQNIDYRLMDQQLLISKKLIDMQKANALPTLSAFYQFTHKLIKPEFDMSPPNLLGLRLNIPIFSSGVRNAQVKQAEVDYYTLQNNQQLLTDQLRMQEKQLRYNYSNALDTYMNLKNNVDVSRRVYASMKLKYEQGIISSMELITADNNYIKAETDLITSMLQLLNANLELNTLYGTITPVN